MKLSQKVLIKRKLPVTNMLCFAQVTLDAGSNCLYLFPLYRQQLKIFMTISYVEIDVILIYILIRCTLYNVGQREPSVKTLQPPLSA